MKKTALVLAALILFGCRHEPKLDLYFENLEGCFVFYNSTEDFYIRYNSERCKQQYTPCSTFKIPNTLIALEEQIINNPDSVVIWDSVNTPRKNYWPDSWAKDQTLRSALQNSVVWFYQKIARTAGKDVYTNYLNKLNYGNKDLSGAIDNFWLGSSLKISAEEQIKFLQKFYNDKLGFSEENTELVKELITLEDTGVYTLFGKTGSGKLPNGNYIGWLVGIVENDKGISYYALNIEAKNYKDISDKRIKLAKQLLKVCGALPLAYEG